MFALLMKSLIIFISAIIFACFIPGCKSQKAGCQSEINKELKISWGEYYPKEVIMKGYELTNDAELYSITRKLNKDIDLQKIGKLDNEKYCDIVNNLEKMFLKVQVINVPADTSRFIEYSNKTTSVTMRAIWNPVFITETNSSFQFIYDSLQKYMEQIPAR